MKLSFILALTICMQANAYTNAQKISLRVEKVSLIDVLKEIKKQSGFHVFYDSQTLRNTEPISLSIKNVSLDEALATCLRGHELAYQIVDKNIIITKAKREHALYEAKNAITADIVVSGTVTDEDRKPLEGVTVRVKNTQTATTTDNFGNFRISSPLDNITLVFTILGYETQEMAVSSGGNLNVVMKSSISDLSEVVVIGYGAVRKSDLTGSVSSVTAEQLTAYPAIGITQALQGRAAGVQITANNGEPGASFKVRIRGGTSINASSDPVFVVDGFVGATLPPPEDIASIEILKDASATAIYGSRGANGVIMVTTKRGQSGKAKIEFNTSYSAQNEINRLDLLNADQFIDYIRDARPNIQPMGANTDWQDAIFRTGGIQNHQLSVSGGTDSLNYYISGAYYDQKGVIIGSEFNRFSITSNLNMKATDKLRLGLNVFAQRTDRDGTRTQEGSGGSTGTGVVAGAFKFEPDQPIWNENGVFTIARLNDPHDNPYAVATQLVNESVMDQIQGNFYAEYDILKDLKFRVTLGATTSSSRTGNYTPSTLNAGRVAGGIASVNGSRSTSLQNENYLTYDKNLFADHNLNVMAGYSFQNNVSENWGAGGQEFITDAFSFWNLGAASLRNAPSSGLSDWVLRSYYGRINYSINGKYLFNLNARYDGSSRFGRNNKWAFFPSGSFAWNMGSENFMSEVSWINQFKWRASYGVTGNQAIDPYATLARFSPAFTIINGVQVNAIRPTTIANDGLSWETTAQTNLGVDIGFLNDRITLTTDVYRMVTSDLLFGMPIPQYTGYSSVTMNIGEVENKGIDINLGGRILTGAFLWSMDFNVSANRNKILALPDGNEIQYGSGPAHMVGIGSSQVLREGLPVGSFFGWIYDGVYQQGDTFLPGAGFEQAPGGERFMDIDDNNMLNAEDRTIIGDPNPNFIYGWNNDFKWKDFDLNIFFQGSQGNDILSYTLMELDLMSGINNATTNALNRWTPTNTDTDVPRAFNGRTRRVSTRFIYDGSFLRLKNLALGYNLPASLLTRSKISRLRLYVSAQNILTFTNYEGYDPEVNYNSSGSVNSNRNLGLDYGSYPNAKSYTIGLNVGF